MFTKILLSLVFSGMLVEAADTSNTVSSPSGVIYNCPNIETIEVAYAASCELLLHEWKKWADDRSRILPEHGITK